MTKNELVNEIKHIFMEVNGYELMIDNNDYLAFELNDYGYVSCEIDDNIIKLSTTRYDLEPEESEMWHKEIPFRKLQQVVRYAVNVKYKLTNSF